MGDSVFMADPHFELRLPRLLSREVYYDVLNQPPPLLNRTSLERLRFCCYVPQEVTCHNFMSTK